MTHHKCGLQEFSALLGRADLSGAFESTSTGSDDSAHAVREASSNAMLADCCVPGQMASAVEIMLAEVGEDPKREVGRSLTELPSRSQEV